ncbi:MAG: NAD(P)/FAD-dependent oxidoreductase [Burkholderiaceae bacterium]|nr:NAD(P)/FAD-dependent oxidoreductase [Burkholderiaceae bacterium]
MNRRHFLQAASALALLGSAAAARAMRGAKVVVIGGGYGGATAAKYIRLLSQQQIDVTLVEPDREFVSCPLSNLVVGGSRKLGDISRPYTSLARNHGVTVIHDYASAIDPVARTVKLAGGANLQYDKLVVSPGIDLNFASIEGLADAHKSGMVLQAWKAGSETAALRRQLEGMQDGEVYAITIPEAPFRCPPGPYERACQVAWYFKHFKPNSKVLVLDANQDVVSKPALFKKAWEDQYAGIVEYRNQHKVIAVSPNERLIRFDVQEDVKADVINALPAMRAGKIAQQTGLANMANNRWCGVNYQTFESSVAKDVFVIGDAIQVAQLMPKSGHMANNHAKVAAAAIVAQLTGIEPNPQPMLTNTCYSFIDDRNVVHVASVHDYVAAERTFKVVQGAGGLSAGPTELEGSYANHWARTIWADMLE